MAGSPQHPLALRTKRRRKEKEGRKDEESRTKKERIRGKRKSAPGGTGTVPETIIARVSLRRGWSTGKLPISRQENSRDAKEEEDGRKERKWEEGGKKRALWEREPDPPRGIAWVGCGGEKDRGRYSAES